MTKDEQKKVNDLAEKQVQMMQQLYGIEIKLFGNGTEEGSMNWRVIQVENAVKDIQRMLPEFVTRSEHSRFREGDKDDENTRKDQSLNRWVVIGTILMAAASWVPLLFKH